MASQCVILQQHLQELQALYQVAYHHQYQAVFQAQFRHLDRRHLLRARVRHLHQCLHPVFQAPVVHRRSHHRYPVVVQALCQVAFHLLFHHRIRRAVQLLYLHCCHHQFQVVFQARCRHLRRRHVLQVQVGHHRRCLLRNHLQVDRVAQVQLQRRALLLRCSLHR